MANVALVGLGAIGVAAHLPALLRSERLRLVAVADRIPERREAAREVLHTHAQSDVAVHDDLDAVLATAGADGVVLATPPWVTPGLTIRAVRAGLAVLAEKPVATSIDAAEQYRELEPEQRARIQVGLSYRHDPALEELRRVIGAGTLGSPLLVRAAIYDEAAVGDPEHDRRVAEALQYGAPVVHEGAHVFDWLSSLLGGAGDIVDAWSHRTQPELAAPNVIGGRLSYPGATVLVEFGWYTPVQPRCELIFLGDRGMASLDGSTFDLTVEMADRPPQRHRFEPDRIVRCFDRQTGRFAALLSGEPADPDLDAGVAALITSHQLQQRALAGAEAA